MAYLRRRPKLAPTARVTIRLTPVQRDLFLGTAELPPTLAHALHRATVREGKLQVRITRAELEQLIAVAARVPASDAAADRALGALLRYLESMDDRFEDAPEEGSGADEDERPGAPAV
jgi:hypothetical protein